VLAVIPSFDVVKIPLPFLEPVFGEGAAVHAFGLLVMLGFVIGGKVSKMRAEKLGLDPDVIERLIGWLVVGTLVGGHVGFGLMYEPEKYLRNPIEFLKFWRGLSSYGGFVVCVPLSVWFFYKEKVPVWPYMDCLAHGLAVGWFFGRMGCFSAHDHPGALSDGLLAVQGICQDDTLMGMPVLERASAACHDLGLYEALWSLGMWFLFMAYDRVPRTPGMQILLLGFLYGPIRFMLDFLRPESTDVRYIGLTPGQYWSVVFFVGCGWLIWKRRRSNAKPIAFAKQAGTQAG